MSRKTLSLSLVCTAAFLLLLGGIQSGSAEEPVSGVVNTGVSVMRADGTQLAVAPIVRIWCGPFDENNRKKPAIHIFIGSQKTLGQDSAATLGLAVVLRDVKRNKVVKLPNRFSLNKAKGASLFVVDGKNEFSAQDKKSAGSINVRSSSCSPYPNLDVEFRDVSVGSELADGPVLRITGRINTREL